MTERSDGAGGRVYTTRLVETSRGPVEIDLTQYGPLVRGWHVFVKLYGDDGWTRDGDAWNSASSDEALGAFLERFLDLPSDEAERLAEAVLGEWVDEWRERGGEAEARSFRRFVWLLAGVLAFILLLAGLGVALLIWMLV